MFVTVINADTTTSTGIPIPSRAIMTIEEQYGVEATGQDWFEVYMAAPFKRGQRVEFVQGITRYTGTVIDVSRHNHRIGSELRYDFRVKYDNKSIPRWTHPQWLKAI